ncbi:uncharacterized protein EHS24_006054 [Apiotrichum porosum]|uniref:Uncharacterized protein n=1 Tax=Apiotrichum porosum TaxID=105984 RepID=A0A427Y0F0_9TREE|nr:uncharacterized protein EHS24_006054 [Apiotrichum porosum]RSH84532.1 hypothetical protein EHS24_006054 [Apiotrichum porosum]
MMIKGFTTATVMAFVALAQSTMTINTPASIIVCQPAAVTWTGGTAPYFVSVIPAGQVAATPIEYLVDGASETSYTWNVNLAANTNITLALRDSTGAVVYSAPLVIQAGANTDCLNATATGNETGGAAAGTATGTGGSGSATENTAGSASPTTGGSNTAAGGSSGSATGAGSSATSAAAGETSKAAGAMGLSAPAGLVAVLAAGAGRCRPLNPPSANTSGSRR